MNLNTKITTSIGETTVKEYFKEALKTALVESPEKRFMGDSDWWTQLANGLAAAGLAPGGTKPCCTEDFCDGEKPCHYEYQCSNKEIKETLLKLIEAL